MIKKILKVAAGLLLLGGFWALYFLGSQIADGLTLSNEGVDTGANSILQMEAWGFDYKTFEMETDITSHLVISSDETEVPLYEMTGKDEGQVQGVVLLVHGLGGDYKSTYPQAEIYMKNKWKVYALDQRASGQSTGPIISYGFYEKRDIESCVDYIQSKYDLPIVVHGISMGGASAGIYAGTAHANAHVSGFIIDSSFDSMENIFSMVWENMNTGIPVDFAVYVGGVVTKLKYGFGFGDTNVSKELGKTEKPTLFIRCKKDTIATEAMVENNYNAIGHAHKSIAEFDSEHVEAVIDFPEAYEAAVMAFLNSF